jgi:hypothetical protein
MSLRDDLQRLYDEYMDEDNDDPGDAAGHYTELHPKIIAALEAAERLVAAWQLPPSSRPIPGSMGGFDVDFDRGRVRHREIQQAEQALTAALKGEQN